MSDKVTGPHDDLTYRVIGSAFKVHAHLGPGHREEAYQRAMERQLAEDGLAFEAERYIEVYAGQEFLGYLIPDLIVEGTVVVELKAFATLHAKYLGQVVTYLNYTHLPVGLLLNFGEPRLRPRRVFPSLTAADPTAFRQWIFVPDWLRADRQQETREPPATPVSAP